MSKNPILKRLGLKDQSPILIIHPPDEYRDIMKDIPAEIHEKPERKYAFIHVFVRNREEVSRYVKMAVEHLEGDGRLWVSYPKRSSKKYTCDICRDTGWDVLGELNFESVTQVSIDEDWSALRFRRVDYIKTMKRKKALSEKGKKRIRGNE